MEDLPHALAALFGDKRAKQTTAVPRRVMFFISPILGGMAGAATLSTAYLLNHLDQATDIGLMGAGGAYLLWTVPLGALLGASLCWLLLRLPRRFYSVGGWLRSWLVATMPGFGAAVIAPMFLGLGPQSPAQMWQGFWVIHGFAWFCLLAVTQLERTQAR